jgi:hypothetical protein
MVLRRLPGQAYRVADAPVTIREQILQKRARPLKIEARAVPRGVRELQRLSGESRLHPERARAGRASLLPCAVSGAGTEPPCNRGVQESDAETESVDRAAVRGGEAVAWDAAVPVSGTDEGQHGGIVHRGGTESQAAAERERLGAAPVAEWGSRVRRPDRLALLADRAVRDQSGMFKTKMTDSADERRDWHR